MNRTVVITGLGAICGRATTASTLFESLESGRSAIRTHPSFAQYGFPYSGCAHIDHELWRLLETAYPDPRLGPHARLALHAAGQALEASGFTPEDTSRAGLFVGSNKNTLTEHQLLALGRHFDVETGRVDLDDYLLHEGHDSASFLHRRQDMAAWSVGTRYGFRSTCCTHGDACAAGGIAIGTGFRHIRHGELDAALVGATEAMCSYVPMLLFGALGALTAESSDQPELLSRPFDRTRSGFVMGEGSAFMMLESKEHAERRGAPILATVMGFAKQCEAWRMTASAPDGSLYARCIESALKDAGLAPEDIHHVNAHGTSTPQNDGCEAAALKRVFGHRLSSLPVTSNKSALGHSLAASGALEAVLSVLSLQRQTLLPTLNFQEPDGVTEGLDIVRVVRRHDMDNVLSLSFGFGGENCALVLGR